MASSRTLSCLSICQTLSWIVHTWCCQFHHFPPLFRFAMNHKCGCIFLPYKSYFFHHVLSYDCLQEILSQNAFHNAWHPKCIELIMYLNIKMLYFRKSLYIWPFFCILSKIMKFKMCLTIKHLLLLTCYLTQRFR